jgi:hypothetical protein
MIEETPTEISLRVAELAYEEAQRYADRLATNVEDLRT